MNTWIVIDGCWSDAVNVAVVDSEEEAKAITATLDDGHYEGPFPMNEVKQVT